MLATFGFASGRGCGGSAVDLILDGPSRDTALDDFLLQRRVGVEQYR